MQIIIKTKIDFHENDDNNHRKNSNLWKIMHDETKSTKFPGKKSPN